MEKFKFQHRRPQARWALGLVAVLAFLTWPGFDIGLGFGGAFVDPSEIPVTWDQITPSRSLHYHNCGDEFQCARLKVPMDYNRTDGKGRSFDLAVVRLPAKVPVTDPRYGGAVLINPGMYMDELVVVHTDGNRWPWWSGDYAGLCVGSQSPAHC